MSGVVERVVESQGVKSLETKVLQRERESDHCDSLVVVAVAVNL